jgi:predicted Zn-dependent peptidase
VRIDWTCDPARTSSLVQRVMEEVASVRNTMLSPGQLSRVRSILLREFEKNSQENAYLLNQISRRYDDGDAANVGAAVQAPRMSELSAYAIQAAAQKYLDAGNYVRVTLMPETK